MAKRRGAKVKAGVPVAASASSTAAAPAASPEPALVVEPLIKPPAPPVEKRIKCSVWFLPSLYEQIRIEAIKRKMSVGEVLEEAMQARVMLINRGTP